MGASPRNSPDYLTIVQVLFDKHLTTRINGLSKGQPIEYASKCSQLFGAFKALCSQFENQKKFAEVYGGNKDYLQPVTDFDNWVSVKSASVDDGDMQLEEFKLEAVVQVENTLKALDPSQVNTN